MVTRHLHHEIENESLGSFFYFVDSKLKGVEANVGTAVGEQVR